MKDLKDFLPQYHNVSEFLPDYLELGLCEIVVIRYSA